MAAFHRSFASAWSPSGGTALPHEQQLLASRVEDPSLSGPDFGVATLLFGRPEHLELRRASARGSLGASEFKATFNDSGINVGNLTAPVDAARLRSLLAEARVNVIEWPQRLGRLGMVFSKPAITLGLTPPRTR